jgi:hypothetical protein
VIKTSERSLVLATVMAVQLAEKKWCFVNHRSMAQMIAACPSPRKLYSSHHERLTFYRDWLQNLVKKGWYFDDQEVTKSALQLQSAHKRAIKMEFI